VTGNSAGHIRFYAIAPDEVIPALAALEHGGFRSELGLAPDPEDPPQIELDASYVRTSALLADGVETGEAVAEAAPSATFHAWTDPADGGLGMCLLHIPGLGIWSSDCDSSGDPVFDGADIRNAIDNAGGADLRQVVRDLTGERWVDALSAARRFLTALPHGQHQVVACPTTPNQPRAGTRRG
jgi:hypothetical protein